MCSQPVPTRTLPHEPNFDQLRKQAKELLQSFRNGDQSAIAEVERFESRREPSRFALADAQRVLARSYGFLSWTALKKHVEGMSLSVLLAAATAGDLTLVRQLVTARPELINPRGPEFRDSVLHRAVLMRNQELTRMLMQSGADARVGVWPHREATSAYAIAVDRGYDEIVAAITSEEEHRRVRLSQQVPAARASVDALHKAIAQGRTAEAVGLMIDDPALINACDLYGVTALHVAAWKHDPELVTWLLDRDAFPDAAASRAAIRGDEPAEQNRTPLDFAAIVAGWPRPGRRRIFYFMENANIDPSRFQATAELLLNKGAQLTPRAAVALGDLEAVVRMHGEGRLSNEIQVYRGGLLAIAARVNRLEMVTALLDLEFDPDETIVTDDGERSSGMPLWFASLCGRLDIAESLLARGADANAVVHACGNALGLCTSEDDAMASLLRRYGAGLTVEQLPEGEEGREIARSILAGTMRGSSLNVSQPTRADLAEQLLWATGDNVIVDLCLARIERPRTDPWWNYVLISSGKVEKIKRLLAHGVDPDVVGNGGFSLLHHLAAIDDGKVDRVAIATLLLDAGASLTKRDSILLSTPVGWACRWGRMELLQLYLSRGVDVRESDAEPWATPLAWALKRGHHEIAQQLQSSGAAN